jgi:geranylgeranyl reductase family protein
MKRFDVVIIGAGPAGSSAAIALGGLGYSVALIDKEQFPREKLCGDFVNPINIPLFRALGVEPQVLSQKHETVTAFRITSFAGGEAEIPLRSANGRTSCGLGLSRASLDNVLLEKARETVTAFQGFKAKELRKSEERWRITIDRGAGSEELSARIVIGADGRNSWVAHRLKLSNNAAGPQRAIGFQMRLQGAAALNGKVEIHLFPGGYAGLVGLGDGTVNLCLAIEKAHMAARQPGPDAWQDCLPQNPWLRAILDRSSVLGQIRSVYPIYFPPRRCYADGALLAGDAARVNEPVTGEGIYFAIKSGMIAAKTVDQALRTGDLSAAQLSLYARDCDRAFRIRRGVNSLIRWLIYRPSLLSPLIRHSSRKRQILAPFVHAICTPAPTE